MIAHLLRPLCWLVGHRDVPVYRQRRAFMFCDRCTRTTDGWTIDTPAPAKSAASRPSNVVPFRRSA